MESWRLVWREGFVPVLATHLLAALRDALRDDDPRLTQGSTTTPPPLMCVQDWPVECGCVLAFAGAVEAGGLCCTAAEYAAALKANGLVAAKVYAVVGSPDGGSAAVAMLRQLAAAISGCGGADACRAVVKRRGLEKVKAAYGGMDATRGPVRELASQLDSAKNLLGLIAEVLAAHESERWCFSYYSGSMDAGEKAFWAAFGVDRAKLLKEVEAETKGPGVQAKRDKVKAKRDHNKKLAAFKAPKKAKPAKVTA